MDDFARDTFTWILYMAVLYGLMVGVTCGGTTYAVECDGEKGLSFKADPPHENPPVIHEVDAGVDAAVEEVPQ